MSNISKIKFLSLWVFLIPFITVNSCLLIVTLFNEYVPHGVGIGPTFPYFDGGTSISRTARNFPTTLIFKPGMILTSVLMIRYWVLNKELISKFTDNKNNTINYFFLFGVLSAVCLIFHAIFLGINFDNIFYKLFRKIVLLSFIIFEILAQSFLILNLYKSLDKISDLINKKILNFKLLLVSTLILTTIVSSPIIIQDGYIHFKHALEWNYFFGVIFFYFLTFIMWKKQ